MEVPLKICDFGYSESSLLHSKPKSTVGTPAYIAPEVLSRREYDGKERELSQHYLSPARFQRTDKWIPVYSWLESLDTDEVVKSKHILYWITENPQVRDQLCFRYSHYHHLTRYKKVPSKDITEEGEEGWIATAFE